MKLAMSEGVSVDEWRVRLRVLLEDREMPPRDLRSRIDAPLAGPPKGPAAAIGQDALL